MGFLRVERRTAVQRLCAEMCDVITKLYLKKKLEKKTRKVSLSMAAFAVICD